MERMLPDVKVDAKNRTFTENTRLSLLMGMRHVLVGVREISTTFEQSLKTDHIKQLQQFKNATNFVNDIINTLKMWIYQIRTLAVHVYTLYNQYIPEVLFGKCLGNYLMSKYPDRSFYEYPFVLLVEMYETILNVNESHLTTTEETDIELTLDDDDLNMAQNEISHSDDADGYVSGWSSNSLEDFNASTKLSHSSSKEKMIENVAEKKSWQICLKLYTAESISRSLKNYFLS
ncbi:uncharacterized protein LOC106088588 [Stomoxys calcitrans]|uniref:uncharacterized protein LOC106088588 n=1 Tax=Stomoxys calcitrans TaxID=35570 RepID=UPI0027E3A367|nr:uncharacterized protein LOC106088588 [Stomoxys calcitrans]